MLEKRIVLLYNIIGNHMFIKEKNDKRNRKHKYSLNQKNSRREVTAYEKIFQRKGNCFFLCAFFEIS